MNEIIPTFFLYWVIYGVIGWIMETIYCSVPAGKFVERGFLNGPIVPIYGFGALFVLSVLKPFFYSPLLVFILGFFLTSILEYITSYIMEKAFGMRWWDYSHYKFNIKGRVCLLNSTMFGVLCVVLVEWIHPIVVKTVSRFTPTTQMIVAAILGVIILVDFIVSVASVLNLKKRLKSLESLHTEMAELIQNFNEKNNQRKDEIKVRIAELKEEYKFTERRLLRSFPTMKAEQFSEFLDDVKASARLKRRKHKKD
ncbi:putative ABC transporter permease [Erysipelothrix tonsillarum]|uniref:putative ABC transporter permease n=1 Tax=Erysipelothrix tonsillarum TaxID=38402 RepID=UPI0003602D67|nr:putative ABC transporter permease [Erysipelothrix tonsillarum]